MPSEPVINIHELARSCAAGVSSRRKQVSGAIRQAETPTPIKNRAHSSCTKLTAAAKARQPSVAASKNTISTRLAPQRSSALPSGNCMAEKPRKYAPASSPSWPAARPSSALNTGASVAVTARTSAEKK